jgi:hypothetical protein
LTKQAVKNQLAQKASGKAAKPRTPEQTLRHYLEELIDYLIKVEPEGFWQLIFDGTPPPMDGSDASKELRRVARKCLTID